MQVENDGLSFEQTPKKSLRAEAVGMIRGNKPIKIALRHYGDVMISWWAHTQVLLQLCQEEGIPMTASDLPLQRADLNAHDTFLEFRAAAQYPGTLHGKYQPAGEMELLCKALGVATLDPALLAEAPQPLRTNDGPLKNFDRETMLWMRDGIQQHRSGKNEITIVQAGSSDFKRYSDEQVVELVQTAKASHQDCHVRVITDRRLSHKDEGADFGADEVVDYLNINQLAAYLSLDKTLFVMTDSFWTWLMAGSQAIVGQEPQVIALYTLADSVRYGIPHATRIESKAVRGAKGPGMREKVGNGMIQYDEYQQYWSGLRRWIGFPGEMLATQIAGIHKNDIKRVKDAIQKAVL